MGEIECSFFHEVQFGILYSISQLCNHAVYNKKDGCAVVSDEYGGRKSINKQAHELCAWMFAVESLVKSAVLGM